MGPPKRKGTSRRQVLDLNSKEDSPSRPTWQTKYQQILTGAGYQQNGDSQAGSSEITSSTTSTVKSNPLSGLVGNYNSDSDDNDEETKQQPGRNLDAKVEDFLKEIQSISTESTNHVSKDGTAYINQQQGESLYPSSVTAWQQCYDQNSGYPYYWNTETNEVTWEMPADLKAAIASVAMKHQQVQQSKTTEKSEVKTDSPSASTTTTTKKTATKYPWQTESDSEDEKIEMITSFGPQSGDESEGEENPSQTSKKKSLLGKTKKIAKNVKDSKIIGPQLPAYSQPSHSKFNASLPSDDAEAEALSEIVYETSPLLTHCIQDTGPPGDDSFNTPKETVSSSHSSTSHDKKEVKWTDSEVPDSSAKDSKLEHNLETNQLHSEATSSSSSNNNNNNNISNDSYSDRKSTIPSLNKVNETETLGFSNEDIVRRLKSKVEILENKRNEIHNELNDDGEVSKHDNEHQPEKVNFADDVIAQIEKETPPDYASAARRMKDSNHVLEKVSESSTKSTNEKKDVSIEKKEIESKSSSIALIANYGDDSESEEVSLNEKRKSNSQTERKYSKPLFPIGETSHESTKPLFPCIDSDIDKSKNFYFELRTKEKSDDASNFDGESSNKYSTETNLPDSTTTHKAFKRKKRIEFVTNSYGPSTSKAADVKPASPEPSNDGPFIQYNMDPSSNEHRGFGFNVEKSSDPVKKKYENYGGIQFIKAETINLSTNSEPKEKEESKSEAAQNSAQDGSSKVIPDEEIEDAAALLKEKVRFLTEGKDEISPVQQMAVQLETLVSAWQQGALTRIYLSRWLNEKCGELTRHEKSAAPPGWTCLWDRKNKRYFYRNATTKATQWDYPNAEDGFESKEGDVEGGGEEMDLCDTPPHSSPNEAEKVSDEPPSTPPPPMISDASENAPPSPTPPPPPQISFCSENEVSSGKSGKKKKRKAEVSSSSEDLDLISIPTPSGSKSSSDKKEASAPPLPPLPPPPPPPPDDPPPPLPESPPPLPLDPDQPLPPGVDEPEYHMYRRLSPKHSFKKMQPDSSTYPPEVMMAYGYGLPVQSVSSSSQAMSIPMQAVDYHGYVHDSLSANPYVVQSAPSSHVIHCPAKKQKLSLMSELDSFYSDIAMLEGGSNENSTSSNPEIPILTHSQEQPSLPTSAAAAAVAIASAASSSTSASANASPPVAKTTEKDASNVTQSKKKKKTKLAPGLSMKKKGVSSLVAKWQQVQQEVRRDYNTDSENDDDDDDVSSTHK